MDHHPPCRERRSWTAKEDQLLRDAVSKEDPNTSNPSKWHAIAKHVPGRTNKDCRKRWFAKMASDVVKGGWSPEEDERLVAGIEKYGTRWSLVASVVQTRNSDQCAKRWTDTLNPAIDRTTWTAEADDLLLRAVEEHGKVWTKIVKTYFPGRTGLSAKNRYNSITRFSPESRNARSRRRSVETGYLSSRKTESVSSSSSASPTTPPLQLPLLSSPTVPLMMPHASHSRYDIGWQSSPLAMSEEAVSLHGYDSRAMHSFSPSPSSTTSDSSYQSLDVNMNLTDVQQYGYSEGNSGQYFKVAPSSTPHPYPSSRAQSNLHPPYPHYPSNNNFGGNYNEPPNQYVSLSGMPSSTDTLVGMGYESQHHNAPLDTGHRYKMQQPPLANFSGYMF